MFGLVNTQVEKHILQGCFQNIKFFYKKMLKITLNLQILLKAVQCKAKFVLGLRKKFFFWRPHRESAGRILLVTTNFTCVRTGHFGSSRNFQEKSLFYTPKWCFSRLGVKMTRINLILKKKHLKLLYFEVLMMSKVVQYIICEEYIFFSNFLEQHFKRANLSKIARVILTHSHGEEG